LFKETNIPVDAITISSVGIIHAWNSGMVEAVGRGETVGLEESDITETVLEPRLVTNISPLPTS
jgi:hypothetical protein